MGVKESRDSMLPRYFAVMIVDCPVEVLAPWPVAWFPDSAELSIVQSAFVSVDDIRCSAAFVDGLLTGELSALVNSFTADDVQCPIRSRADVRSNSVADLRIRVPNFVQCCRRPSWCSP